uniref:Uncharacterized protein n=1 Tax=Timema bartmani TaxID=61472 RepID=A0A7R9F2F3_9NEOP|nr:unnamed protein product [Timema bartmani]
MALPADMNVNRDDGIIRRKIPLQTDDVDFNKALLQEINHALNESASNKQLVLDKFREKIQAVEGGADDIGLCHFRRWKAGLMTSNCATLGDGRQQCPPSSDDNDGISGDRSEAVVSAPSLVMVERSVSIILSSRVRSKLSSSCSRSSCSMSSDSLPLARVSNEPLELGPDIVPALTCSVALITTDLIVHGATDPGDLLSFSTRWGTVPLDVWWMFEASSILLTISAICIASSNSSDSKAGKPKCHLVPKEAAQQPILSAQQGLGTNHIHAARDQSSGIGEVCSDPPLRRPFKVQAKEVLPASSSILPIIACATRLQTCELLHQADNSLHYQIADMQAPPSGR